MNKHLTYLNQTKVQILIFALIIALFYGNTLSNGFVHDDVWQVETNNNIQSLQNIPKIFSGCISEALVGKCSEKGYYYRPLQNISYLLTYQISDKPWIFHFLNLTLLFILAILIYNFFKILLGAWKPAFLGTIIFLINPIISEVVNWISAVPELLMSIFMICSLIFAVKFGKSARIAQFVLSITFLFLALLSKETAVFLSPLVLVVMLINVKIASKILKLFLIFLFPLVIYFFIRSQVLGRVVYEYEGYYGLSGYEQVLNAFYFYGKYILKLIYPLPLSFQQLFLPVKSINFGVFLGGVLGVFNLVFIFYFFKKNLKVLALGLLIINLSILPALVFINKIGEFLFSERYLFFASIGFALFLTEFLRFSLTTRSWKAEFRNLAIFLLVFFFLLSWFFALQRNVQWKDNLSSYSAMIKIDPSNSKAYFQRGQIYLSQGLLAEAKKDYKNALDLDPGNLVYKQALSSFPAVFTSKKGIGFLYPKNWQLEESEDRVILKDPDQKLSLTISNVILDPASPEKNLKTHLDPSAALQDDKETYGKLVNQGQALIPGWDEAYVRVWEETTQSSNVKSQILEFFLFKEGKVVKVLLDPVVLSLMGEVDGILGSIKM